MKYAYDIKINLKENLINFYEWNTNDNILNVNKIPVFRVNSKLYNLIINKSIIVGESFLNTIHSYNTNNNYYLSIFTYEYDSVCVEFINGKIKRLSKLLLEDEEDIIDNIKKIETFDYEYKTVINTNNYSYMTREENSIIKSILKEIENSKNDDNKINYLYYEWFNNLKSTNKYNDLINGINTEYTSKHKDFYNIIKLIDCKNV